MLYNAFFRFAPLMTATAFVWQENIGKILTTAFLSMVPTFEGRYAVPVAVAMGMPTLFAFLLAFICSSIPVPFILLLLRPVLDWFYTLPIKPVRKFAAWLEARGENKRRKMHENKDSGLRGKLKKYVSSETIELIGLYIFVALPLPGTGGWTGSLIATLFKMPRMKSFITIVLGNATACLITTLATTGILAIF